MPHSPTNSTVEERIVEMRFDNKQFESGVKQTMSTLDKLKEKLVFKNDVKGLDNIQNSVNRFDLSVAMRGIDAFQQKLSALQIFGKRIVENLADDFYGAINKVENGIRGVFQQISTGGANRALNIEQAKFQLEGLHIAWEDIKGDIDYAVSGTAYGLDAAARVAAQLSASQIQVGDDMKAALRGISGVAAMTNSSYEEIGRIFSQVAGAGRLYTQDMLQMSSRGLNIAAALGQQLGHTEAEIRDMVTKGQIDFKTFATAMNEAFGEQATKANNTYTGSLSNVKAALSRIGADIKAGHFETFRQVFVDLIPKLNEFKKAFKPVENIIIEVDAAIGKLLQKIISTVDVTKLVSRIAKPVEKVGKRILKVVDAVTTALEQVDAPLKAMKEFAYVSREAAMQMSGFGDAVKSTAKEEKEALNLTEDMQKAYQAAQDIWNSGKYGNGQARIDALRAAGIDPDKTQAIIEEFIKNGGNWEEAIKKVSETTSEAVDENSEKAEKLTKKVQTLATIFRNIKRTFKAVVTSVTNVISALFKSVTGSLERFGLGDILIKITGKIADIAEKFTITKEAAEKLTKPVKILLSIINGAFKLAGKVVKVIFNIASGVVNLIYTIGSLIAGNKNFQQFANKLEDGIMRISRAFGNLVKNAKQSAGLQKFLEVMKLIGGTIFGVIGNVIIKIVDGLGWAITKLEKFLGLIADIFMGLFKGTGFVGSKIGDFFKSIIDSIGIGNFVEDFKATFNFLGDSKTQKEAGGSIFTKIFGFIKGVLDWVVEQFNSYTLDDYLVVIKELISITTLLATMGLIKNIQNLAKNGISLLGSINKVLKSTAKVNKSIARLNNAKAFAQIAKVILAFAASVTLIMFTVMKTADYISSSDAAAQAFETAVNAVKEMIGKVFLSILGIIVSLKSIDLAISMFTSKTKLHVPVLLQFGVFMLAIGYAIKQVLKAMTDLYDMKDEVLKKGGKRLITIAGGIAAFFTVLTLITSVINKFFGGTGGEQATKGLYAMSVVLIAMSASIDILMAAVSWMSMMIMGYGEDVVDKAVKKIDKIIWTIMGTLSLLLVAGGFFGSHTTNQDLPKTFVSLAILFGAIAASMVGIMIAINDLTLSMIVFPKETIASFFMIWFFLETILVTMGFLSQEASKIETSVMGRNVVSSLTSLMLVIGAMVSVVSYFATNIKDDRQLFALVGALSGITLIVTAMGYLVRNLGSNKLKAKNILSVAVVFTSLGVVLGSLLAITKIPADRIGMTLTTLSFVVFMMQYVIRAATKLDKEAFKNVLSLGAVFASLGVVIYALKVLTEQPVENIATAMGGLALVVYAMSKVIEAASGLKNKAYKNIAALFLAFVGVGAMLVPLSKLKGEDWPGYLTAMVGLGGVVSAFALVLKVMDATITPGKIMAIGGSIGIITVAFALLAGVLSYMSTIVNVENLIAIAVTVGLLGAAVSAIVILLAKSGPTTLATIGKMTLSIVAISAAILGVVLAINLLMERFPEFQKNLQDFAYTLGTLPGYIIKGLLDGLAEAFPHIAKAIRKLLGDNVIEPAEETLDINSPSKVFEKIGIFTGLGFEKGLKESFSNIDTSQFADVKDQIVGALPDGLSIGEGFGGDIVDGISNGINLDNLSLDNVNLDNFKIDGLDGAVDISNLGVDTQSLKNSDFLTSLRTSITETASEAIRGTNFTDLYTLDDLIADPNKYDLLKKAGETQLTSAYERMKEHEDFLAKYPTFDSWFADKDVNLGEDWVAIYNNADEAHRKFMEDSVRQNYLDLSKLDNEVIKYTNSWKDYTERVLNPVEPQNIAQEVQRRIKAINSADTTIPIKFSMFDTSGNSVGIGALKTIFSNGSASLGVAFDGPSLRENLDAVSSSFTTAINDMTREIAQKLDTVSSKIETFDSNQEGRTNNLSSRMGEVGNSMNNLDVILDTGAVVGQLVGPMDSALGEMSRRRARG